MQNKLCLIDAHSIIHRCFHARMMDLTAPNGEQTKATFGFVRILDDFFAANDFTHCITAFDCKKETLFKKIRVPSYKEKRSIPDDSLFPQIKRCRKLTKLMKLHCVKRDGYEADDIIGSAVSKFRKLAKIVIVTCDKDLMQVMSNRVRIYHPFDRRYVTIGDVIAKWGVPPEQVLEVMTLTGDSTDNVKGVHGIGIKNATQLIRDFGTVASLQENWRLLPKKKALAIKQTNIEESRYLMSLLRDVPLKELDDYKAPRSLKTTVVRQALSELGINSLAKKP